MLLPRWGDQNRQVEGVQLVRFRHVWSSVATAVGNDRPLLFDTPTVATPDRPPTEVTCAGTDCRRGQWSGPRVSYGLYNAGAPNEAHAKPQGDTGFQPVQSQARCLRHLQMPGLAGALNDSGISPPGIKLTAP